MIVDLVVGALVSLPAAVLAHGLGVSWTGGAIGLLIGAVTYAAFHLAGLMVVAVALVLTLATTRVALARALHHGVDRTEGRSAANIIANCGVGLIAAVLELTPWSFGPDTLALWFVTAIAAGASDTVASEIGEAFGGTPRTFPTWRVTTPGTPGAVSAAGTVAGVLAAAAIAAPAVALWLLPNTNLPLIVGACLLGTLVESAAATAFESRGLFNNHALNVLNTATAALAATLWTSA